jgi:hypothetical protein
VTVELSVPSRVPGEKKENLVTPPTQSRPFNLALVLAICAAILSARLFLGYGHVDATPPSAQAETSSEQHDELPPVW